jgi:hypothetical protein
MVLHDLRGLNDSCSPMIVLNKVDGEMNLGRIAICAGTEENHGARLVQQLERTVWRAKGQLEVTHCVF